MFEKLANIFRVPDLRKRVLFTLALLAVYRLGGHIPTPGIDAAALSRIFERMRSGPLGLVDLFSGGQLSKLTIFALGIMPYITSSIIFQLLTVIYEPLAKLQKEGELGRKKITQWTRYMTVVLGAIQAAGIAITLQKGVGGEQVVTTPGTSFLLMTVLTLTAGTAFIMWLGEQITERGIGNGMSLIIFAGIVARLPSAVTTTLQFMREGELGPLVALLILALSVLVVGAIIFVERGQRRIPMQYAKRVVGRKMYGGMTSHLPLKINTANVIPPIFASSILIFPATLAQFANHPWV